MKIEILRDEGSNWEETDTTLSMLEWDAGLSGKGPNSVLSPDGGVFIESQRVHSIKFPDGRRWDEVNGWWSQKEIEQNA